VAAASAEGVAATTASTDRHWAERRARIVRSEARQHTNRGVTPPPPHPSFSDDEAEQERVIGPEDFVKDETEEARALAQTAEGAAVEQTMEEADRRAMPRGWRRPPASRR
jgi:hypothetical protein